MAQRQSLLGVFRYLDDLVQALEALRDKGIEVHTVYSPVPRHEIREVMRLGPSPVRYFTLFGGAFGVLLGVWLVAFTSVQWNFIVSGKPIIPKVPAVIVGFEFLILLGVLFNLIGLMINLRLPRFRLPDHYDVRLNQDRFGIYIECPEARREEASRILKESGAEEVHEFEK